MTTSSMPAGAGPATPENDEPRGQAGFIRDQETGTDSADSAEAAAERKRFQSLRASLAFNGHELYATDGGPYVVRRWGLTKDLKDLEAVEQFARQVGCPL